MATVSRMQHDPETRSNIHPSGFDASMPETLATAAVDRLLHPAHAIITHGSSLRLSDAILAEG